MNFTNLLTQLKTRQAEKQNAVFPPNYAVSPSQISTDRLTNRLNGGQTSAQEPAPYNPLAVHPDEVKNFGATKPPESVEAAPVQIGQQVYGRPSEIMTLGGVMPENSASETMPQLVTDAPYNPLAVNPYTLRREQADRALYDAENKDWKGKDRDKDHNAWDAIKTGLIGAGLGFLRGGLGGAIVQGGAGVVQGALDRNADEKMINNNFTLPRLQQAAGRAREAEANDLNAETKRLNNNWYAVRPDVEREKTAIQRMREETNRRYKEDSIALGTKRADEIKIYRDAIVDLRAEGVEQNDQRIKLLERQIEETIRRNAELEKDRDADREARIKVENIRGGYGLQRTQMQQDGANYRQGINIEVEQKRFNEVLKLKREAEANNNLEEANRQQTRINTAKMNGLGRIKSGSMTADQYYQIFGERPE